MNIHSKISLAFLFGCVLMFCSFTGDNPGAKKYFFTSYLGCTAMDVSMLPKKSFDSLIALPICAKDSNQKNFPITSFDITYAERGLYQDSAGLPIIFTDYTNAHFEGTTISKEWISLFNERSYKGDTIYVDNVKVKGTDNKSYACKGMKIIIK